MKSFLVFLFFLLAACPAFALPGTDRAFPMGDRTALFDKLLYTNKQQTVKFEYYLLGPKKIEPGAKYPLIVVLHGQGGHAYGAYVLADEIVNKDMPAFVIVPVVSPKVNDWATDLFKSADPALPKPIDHVAALTRKLIDKLPIDPARIYVTGYTMGGVGTFGALKYHPDLFAAGISICGGWPAADAKKFVSKPMWVFHGADDSLIPVAETRDISNAINKAGGHVKYTLYPGINHDSWVKAYAEPGLWNWLFSQKLEASTTPSVTEKRIEPAAKKIIRTTGPAPKTAPKAQKMP